MIKSDLLKAKCKLQILSNAIDIKVSRFIVKTHPILVRVSKKVPWKLTFILSAVSFSLFISLVIFSLSGLASEFSSFIHQFTTSKFILLLLFYSWSLWIPLATIAYYSHRVISSKLILPITKIVVFTSLFAAISFVVFMIILGLVLAASMVLAGLGDRHNYRTPFEVYTAPELYPSKKFGDHY